MSLVTCHMSGVGCPMAHAKCHMSHISYPLSITLTRTARDPSLANSQYAGSPRQNQKSQKSTFTPSYGMKYEFVCIHCVILKAFIKLVHLLKT